MKGRRMKSKLGKVRKGKKGKSKSRGQRKLFGSRSGRSYGQEAQPSLEEYMASVPPWEWPEHLRPQQSQPKPMKRQFGVKADRLFPDRKTLSRQANGLAAVPVVDEDGNLLAFDETSMTIGAPGFGDY